MSTDTDTDLAYFEEFPALNVDGYSDGTVVRIGFADESDNMAVLQIHTQGGVAEVLLSMETLRDMSVETGHLAHGR